MGYTVVHPAGMTKDSEFREYVRLLSQTGVDIGRVPRVSEPGTDRRWLYVWDSEARAEGFAKELKKRTRIDWKVNEVNAPSSEGPLGPLLVQLARQADGLTLALHPLGRALIHSAFPGAASAATSIFIEAETWDDFRRTRGGLRGLIPAILPNLAGLPPEDLDSLGFTVIDADSDETLISKPPASLAHQ
jgi:hypothetical protein